jgi:protein-tyrosine-phosphatase
MAEAARATAAVRGSLAEHRSRRLDAELVARSELLLCAAESHRQWILALWPGTPREKVRLFNEPVAQEAGGDVGDPYGWDQEIYDLASRVIDRAMEAWAHAIAGR